MLNILHVQLYSIAVDECTAVYTLLAFWTPMTIQIHPNYFIDLIFLFACPLIQWIRYDKLNLQIHSRADSTNCIIYWLRNSIWKWQQTKKVCIASDNLFTVL